MTILPLPLGGNVIHKRFDPEVRKSVSDILTASIQFSLDHRPEAVQHALQYARDMGRDLADKFIGMYVNHWTLDYGERGRQAIRRFLGEGYKQGLIPVPSKARIRRISPDLSKRSALQGSSRELPFRFYINEELID